MNHALHSIGPKNHYPGDIYVCLSILPFFPFVAGWKRGPNPWVQGHEFYDIESRIKYNALDSEIIKLSLKKQ